MTVTVTILVNLINENLSDAKLVSDLRKGSARAIVIHMTKLLSARNIFPTLVTNLVLTKVLTDAVSATSSRLLTTTSDMSRGVLHRALKLGVSRGGDVLTTEVAMIVVTVLNIIVTEGPSDSMFNVISFT